MGQPLLLSGVLLLVGGNGVRLSKLQPAQHTNFSFNRFLLDDAPSARCLDGTPGGGYIHVVPESPLAVVQLEGGGFCDDLDSCSARVADSERGLGSSVAWGEQCGEQRCSGILSPSCTENPDFCNASKVFLRFCSGDHWRGTHRKARELCSSDGRCDDFWFSGEHILGALLERLTREEILREGSRLVLAGRSSGGIGVMNHIDRVADALGAKGVHVRGLLLWSFDVDYPTLPEYRIPWFRSGHARDQKDTRRKYMLYAPHVPRACLKLGPDYAQSPWMCKPPEVVSRLSTPVFVATNFWSSLAMADFVLNATTCAYVKAYGLAARLACETVARARTEHGFFAASCFAHSVPWSTVVPSPACRGLGCSLQRVFSAWYFGDGRGVASVIEQDCADPPCNTLCTSQRINNVGSGCAAPRPVPAQRTNLLQPPDAASKPRRGPRPAAVPSGFLDADEAGVGCKKLEADLQRNGYVVLRKAFASEEIDGVLRGMNRILDGYAQRLMDRSMINSTYSELPLDERALAIFKGHPEAAPKFLRSELHTSPEVYDIFSHRIVRQVASCILKTGTLVLYPVYMARMNLPGMKQNENRFHQDSLYTYEYFNINATAEVMQAFMGSQLNFWAPLKDVDADSGTLMLRRAFQNRIGRYKEAFHRVHGSVVSELQIEESELPEEDLVLLDDLRAGDLVVFPHYTPHRGTPNRAVGRLRWSMDWRIQNGLFSTMRDESGYLIQSDRGAGDANLVPRARWGSVRPAPRWTERDRKVPMATPTACYSAYSDTVRLRAIQMELDGSRTARAPEGCVAVAGGASCDHAWWDHP